MVDKTFHVDLIFDSLDEFYKECETIEEDGPRYIYNEVLSESKRFNGLSNADILKYKHSYPPGLEKLEELEEDLDILASSAFDYKWDEIDGDDMDMERLYESNPSLRKRFRKDGAKNGKFINLYINISENCNVDHDHMLYKALTATQLTDMLEERGYRVAVYVITAAMNVGRYKGKNMTSTYTEIKIKNYSDPLIKTNLITTVSPWCMRRWHLLLSCAKFHVNSGIGRAVRCNKITNTESIYIDNGECLNKESAINKIKQINKLFQ